MKRLGFETNVIVYYAAVL